MSVPLVTRSILEVVIPPYAAAELVKKSRKLALISEVNMPDMSDYIVFHIRVCTPP